ncbi:uncharacterized protein ARMOST_09934 [Armillaria ostoyae]|uniref:Retrotransposon gag domain-containing protein n=1 Tax=Armillaria ostoyae TaxID=47428 RepID=A0A284RCV5_ARMOS|nr:uncharacterized protein ARMOST_09934 [Armillaria ostoyae]
MTTTFTYPPDAEDGQRKKTPIFSMDDIPASASKENPELFGSASIGGQPSHRETYTHSNFTARHSNLKSETPNLFNSPRGTSHHRQTGIFDRYRNDLAPETLASQPMNGGQSDSPDTEDDDEEEPETPTHTPHHRNLDDDPPDNQPGSLNSPGGPGGPGGPNRPGGPSRPGRPNGPGGPGGPGGPNGPGHPNNLPNKQDFLQEFMNLLHGIKEPDTFDGSDPQKLKAFIVSLQLNFNDRPMAFTTDASKVNYAISFLSGTALDWFEPDILCPNLWNPPAWQHSYAAFLDELRTNFSPFDAVGDAEDALEHLRMHGRDRIMKYMVQFNQYASQVGYGDNSLCHAFYRGLCTCIKDDMAHHGKPNNLRDMRFLAQELDTRYWTRRTEISRETQDNKTSSSYSNNPKSKGSSSNSNSSASGSTLKSSDSTSSGSASTPKPYADKLGKDGHLTQEEKDHCKKNNLCMFCGGKHKTDDCNKHKAAASAKGCAAEVEDPPPASEEPALSELEN